MNDELEKIYAKIPASHCKEGCFECCRNMIQFSAEEEAAMGGYEYNSVCSHLVEGKCTVYESRPFVCRIFGTSEILKCEDCIPDRFLDINETQDVVKEYSALRKKEKTYRGSI